MGPRDNSLAFKFSPRGKEPFYHASVPDSKRGPLSIWKNLPGTHLLMISFLFFFLQFLPFISFFCHPNSLFLYCFLCSLFIVLSLKNHFHTSKDIPNTLIITTQNLWLLLSSSHPHLYYTSLLVTTRYSLLIERMTIIICIFSFVVVVVMLTLLSINRDATLSLRLEYLLSIILVLKWLNPKLVELKK